MLPDEFGCVVANRFGFLLEHDDVDPFDLLIAAQTEKDIKKKRQEDEKKSKQKKHGQKESQRDRRVPLSSEPPEPAPACKLQSRASMTEKEEGHRATKRVAYEVRKYPEDIPQEFSVSRPPSEVRNVNVRGGFKGGKRGGGGGRGFMRNPDNLNTRGKREYDRHNGTGIPPEEKRGGRGPWNWGSVNEAACELMEVTETANLKSEELLTSADEENPKILEEEGEMVVHVAVEMSLDEWKAMQEMNRPKVEFNIRKTEGKIPSKAKVIHESKNLEKLKNSLGDLDENTFLRRSVNDITSLMDINFGSLGRPNRGGRGRGGPRGGIRGGATVQPEKISVPQMVQDLAPDPYDPEDFPALSVDQ